MNSQEGLRFCPYCGRERVADARFCAGCGKPLDAAAATAQPVAAAPALQPGFVPPPQPVTMLAPAPRRLSPGVIVAIVVGAVLGLVLLSGGAFAYSQGLFSSPKQFLLQHMGKARPAGATLDSGVSAKLQLKLTGLSGEAEVLKEFENQPVDLAMTLLPSQRLMRLSLDSAVGQAPFSAAVYADADRLIIDTSGIAPLVEELSGEDLSDLPAYVYMTDREMGGQISAMWTAIDEGLRQQRNSTPTEAQQDLSRFILEAVPDRFFERTQWNEIQFRFDHRGAEEIIQAVVGRFYDEPETAAYLLADVVSAMPDAQGSREEIRNDILRELRRTEERDDVMREMANAFAESPLRIEEHTLTLGWSLGGSASFTLTGGITMRDPSAGMTLSYAYDTTVAGPASVQLPALTRENSMSAEAYFQMKMEQMAPPTDYYGEGDYSWTPGAVTVPGGYTGHTGDWGWSEGDSTDIWSDDSDSAWDFGTWEPEDPWEPENEDAWYDAMEREHAEDTHAPTQPGSPADVYTPPSYSLPSGPVTRPCSPSVYNPC